MNTYSRKYVAIGQTEAQAGTKEYTKLTVHGEYGKRGYTVGLSRNDSTDVQGDSTGRVRQYNVPDTSRAFGTPAEADAHFDALVARLTAEGWQARAKRARLAGIPTAAPTAPTADTTAAPTAPTADTTAAPTAAPTAADTDTDTETETVQVGPLTVLNVVKPRNRNGRK